MMIYLQVQEFDYPLAEPAAMEWGCYIDSVLSRENATCTQEELEGHMQQTCTWKHQAKMLLEKNRERTKVMEESSMNSQVEY